MSNNENKLYLGDGNEFCANVAYRLTDMAVIYPITPSSPMAEYYESWAVKGIKNVFNRVPDVNMMQSEAGAIAAVHGSLMSGVLTTTFTASQGLLLMIPNMYKIAGELTPFVMHVTARTVATHALSIFGDHSDVMACRQTGFAMLASNSIQEVHDMAAIAHASTFKAKVPFMHFFDGFRTSHEVGGIEKLSDDQLCKLMDMDKIEEFNNSALNPEKPFIRGTAQNPDVFFQAREASNPYYNNVIPVVKEKMNLFAELTGRKYNVVDYVGPADADNVIVVMGSGAEVVEETLNFLNSKGEKNGLVKVRLYRPFPVEDFVKALPASVKKIAVLDRTKESGSIGEPLYLDVVASLKEMGRNDIKVIGGRYGLSSKDFNPAMAKAVFDELKSENPKQEFSVGINDDITKLSLTVDDNFEIEDPEMNTALFYGLGSDGTVGANKNSIKIIAEEANMFGQGYFEYDSKKSGSITISHLRFSKHEIHSPYFINKADFIAVHHFPIFYTLDVLARAKNGATLLVNSPFKKEALWKNFPLEVQQQIIEKKINVYAINANNLARDIGMGRRTNTIMQTCFFSIANIINPDVAIASIKKAIEKTYMKKGQAVVETNYKAVDQAISHLYKLDIPASVDKDAEPMPDVLYGENIPDFVKNTTAMIIAGKGNDLPVSAFTADGKFPTATTKYEKRKIATEVPVWDPEICIQCGKCAFVCPHAAIRTKVATDEDLKNAPSLFKHAKYKTKEIGEEYTNYIVQVSPYDCTGCNLCVKNCPALNKEVEGRKAINMESIEVVGEEENARWDFFQTIPYVEKQKLNSSLMKHTQLMEPLFEFSGACAGCGETPYIKLITQLFGDRMVVANATGCSSIYGGNLPTTPYATNVLGQGPAWANSLFEDNAEFGYGMRLAIDKNVDIAKQLLKELSSEIGDNLVDAIINNTQSDDAKIAEQRKNIQELNNKLSSLSSDKAKLLASYSQYLLKKSVWLFGGDGWAYDIGYGGLDHVINMDRNVNILVLDTEVYSNTGGQQSKSTPLGAGAKFSSAGRKQNKKDLGLIAMAGNNAYVAKIALLANPMQALKAIKEAEAFDGPSIIIAYSPCIAHGYDLMNAEEHEKFAVQSGYWGLYRFNPRLIADGKSPLQIDSKQGENPVEDLTKYFQSENRFREVHKSDMEILVKSRLDGINYDNEFHEHIAKFIVSKKD